MRDTKKEVDKMKNTMKKPVKIPVEKLHPFAGHPFKVKDDEEMNTLIEKHTDTRYSFAADRQAD